MSTLGGNELEGKEKGMYHALKLSTVTVTISECVH